MNFIPTKEIEKALGVTIATTEAIKAARELARQIINGNATWNTRAPSQHKARVLSMVLAKKAALEAKAEITGSPMADHINGVIEMFMRKKLQSAIESGVNYGSVLCFPYMNGNDIDILTYDNNQYYPIAYNERGRLDDVAVTFTIERDKIYYTLLMRCTYDSKARVYVITRTAWQSRSADTLGVKITLSEVEEWSALEAEQPFYNQDAPWFVEYNSPQTNYVDPGNPQGVPLIAGSEKKLQDIDELEQATRDEFDRAKSRLGISRDLVKKDLDASPSKIPSVFLLLDEQPKEQGMVIFNPDIRYAQYRERRNDMYRDFEASVGVAFGTISDAAQQARTATEIQATQAVTVTSSATLQDAWQPIIEHLIESVRMMSIEYQIVADGHTDVSWDWNDGIFESDTEIQAARAQMLTLMYQAYNIQAVSVPEIRVFMQGFKDFPIDADAIEHAKAWVAENAGAFE